ncbi:hypothetical protein H5410_030252 [Solanum commersonii]|uniref:DUF1985 domain-containing protein n=1 Tax=Solanum commersonii TaxID=4109 RepID=A0A9J5YF71_SOLCO|nr:hypothetical protein H5410_030252 [Solanum commersonii]
MPSSRTNRKLCSKIQKLSTLLPKYLESSGFFLSQRADCGLFVVAYTEFLSNGLQVPSYGIISQTLRMRYASLLWNYGILKARSGYVKIFDFVVANTNIMPPIKRKNVLTNETINTKIQKRPRTKTCRKKNENSTSTLLEELASEVVSSSQPNVTGDSIIRSAMRKSFDLFRTILKENGLENFFWSSCFGQYLDLPEKYNARFQMTMSRKKGEAQTSKEQSTEEQDLVSSVGPSLKNPQLIYLLNDKDTPKKHKESLCLLWFVNNVLLAKDVNNNIALKLVKLFEDIEASNNYPWGHDSYELTVKYLLAPLSPKTSNLFDFPWAFKAWAFEAIPHLRNQVTTAEEEISDDTFVVHPWLVQIEKELQMPSLITLGLVETLFDLVVDNVKREFLGATTTKRARLDDQPLVVFNEDDMVDVAVKAGVNIGAGVGVQSVGATSCSRCSDFLCEKCEKCKKHDESGQEEKKILYQGNTKFEEENIWIITNGRMREIYINEIISLMRERHLRYLEYYDSKDRILDLNIYTNFKKRYDNISEEATTVGGKSFPQLINEFEWDEDMINYVRGIRPYPGGMDWIGAKRILTVMNLNKTHFVTLEILLHEGRMNVYDFSLMGMEHEIFLTFIQHVFELLPKLLKQS